MKVSNSLAHNLRLLQTSQSNIEMLETRLAAAQKTEVIMAQDLQVALAEQAQLEAQLSALREQMEENKTNRRDQATVSR